MLVLNNVNKSYGKEKVLKDINVKLDVVLENNS